MARNDADARAFGDLSQVLDEALQNIRQGESVQACLARYPQYAAALEPLLQAAEHVQTSASDDLPAGMQEWLNGAGSQEFTALASALTATRPRAAALPDALDAAITSLRQGTTPAQALSGFPSLAAELGPLAHLGGVLHDAAAEPLPTEMQQWVRTEGAREFAQMAAALAPRYARKSVRVQPRVAIQRTAAAVAVMVVLAGAVDTASASSIPGEPLYNWKRAREEVSVALTSDPVARRELLLDLAQRRNEEVRLLVAKGEPRDSQLVQEAVTELKQHSIDAVIVASEIDADTKASTLSEVQMLVEDTSSIVAQAPTAEPAAVTGTSTIDLLGEILPTVVAVAPTAEPTLPPTRTASPVPDPALPAGVADDGAETVLPTTPPPPSRNRPTVTPPTPTVPAIAVVPTAMPAPATPVPTVVVPAPSLSPVPATAEPTGTANPSATSEPTGAPTAEPTDVLVPTASPTRPPTATPVQTSEPSVVPTQPTLPPPPTIDIEEPPTATPRPPSTPTATPTVTPKPTATPTDTPEPTPTDEPTATPTDTPEPTPTATPTDEPTATATPTATPTDEPTATPTAMPTDEPTATPTDEPTATSTATPTDEPTATVTETITATVTVTIVIPSLTPEPSVTPTDEVPTPAPTLGPPAPTLGPPAPTETPEPTETPTETPTSTIEPVPAPTLGPPAPTETPEPPRPTPDPTLGPFNIIER